LHSKKSKYTSLTHLANTRAIIGADEAGTRTSRLLTERARETSGALALELRGRLDHARGRATTRPAGARVVGELAEVAGVAGRAVALDGAAGEVGARGGVEAGAVEAEVDGELALGAREACEAVA